MYQLQSQIVVHRDLDILFGTEISLGGLDGRVPQQKLDLFQIPASVEQPDNPELRGKPVVVAWRGNRSVVCAASYEAQPYGVRSATPGGTGRTTMPVKERGRCSMCHLAPYARSPKCSQSCRPARSKCTPVNLQAVSYPSMQFVLCCWLRRPSQWNRRRSLSAY